MERRVENGQALGQRLRLGVERLYHVGSTGANGAARAVIVSAPVRRRGWPTGATQRDGSRGLPRNVMKAGHLQEFSSTVRFDGATSRGDARGVHARHRRREGRGRTSWLSFITFHVALDGRRRGRGGFDRWPAGTGCRGAIETRLGEVRRRGLGSRRGDGRSGRSGRERRSGGFVFVILGHRFSAHRLKQRAGDSGGILMLLLQRRSQRNGSLVGSYGAIEFGHLSNSILEI